MKKFIIIFVAAMIILFLAGCIISSFYFYNVAIARTEKAFLNDNEGLESSTEVSTNNTKYSWLEDKNVEQMEIKSYDGLKLQGYYIPAEIPTKKTAILAHGYSSQGKDMINYAKFYHDKLGYNVLMPDTRGHGSSEGDYIGFGWPDRKDYIKWVNYIIEKSGQDSEIILHGVSMGGATVLMVSGEKLPSNVKAIVSDCAYSSVKEQLEYQLKRMYNLPSFPIMSSTSLLTKIRAGYFFEEASVLKQVAKSKTPILFIHGDVDTFVPFEMVNKLYNKCASNKEIFVVAGAEHAAAYSTDKEGYEKKVTEFLNKYVQTN